MNKYNDNKHNNNNNNDNNSNNNDNNNNNNNNNSNGAFQYGCMRETRSVASPPGGGSLRLLSCITILLTNMFISVIVTIAIAITIIAISSSSIIIIIINTTVHFVCLSLMLSSLS